MEECKKCKVKDAEIDLLKEANSLLLSRLNDYKDAELNVGLVDDLKVDLEDANKCILKKQAVIDYLESKIYFDTNNNY